MKALLGTYLLFALLSPVAPLRCRTCFGYGEKCKDEDVRIEECKSDQDACLDTTAYYSIFNFPLNFTYKGCVNYNECHQGYYALTYGYPTSIQVKAECCGTDECNVQHLHLPDRNSLPLNGVQCPVCLAKDADYCDSQGRTIQCRGIENECVDSTFDISPLGLPYMTFAAKGCATSDVCSYPTGKTQLANGLLELMLYQLQCQGVKGSSKQLKDEI